MNVWAPMYVHGLVAFFFFFDFPKKWTADSAKQENKLVWPYATLFDWKKCLPCLISWRGGGGEFLH